MGLDESTGKKIRMDVGRVLVLVLVSSREVINKLLTIKINNFFHEKPFLVSYPQLSLDRNFQSSVDSSSDVSDCVYATLDSLEKVLETVFSSSPRCAMDEDAIFSKFENADVMEKDVQKVPLFTRK